MPRERDPNRERAFEMWRPTRMDLVEIASQLGISPGTVRGWKSKDNWESRANGTFQTEEKNVPNGTERSENNGTEREGFSWAAIETEYITDIRKKPCTLEDLANKYKMSLSRIMKYAAENDWSAKRRSHVEAVKKKTAEKAADIISDDIAKVTAKHFRISDKLLSVVEKSLNSPNEFHTIVEKLRTGYGPGEFKEEIVTEVVDSLNDSKLLNVVNAFEKLQRAQRQTLRILDEKDKQKLEIDRLKTPDNTEGETEDDGFIDALKGKSAEVWDDE